MPVFSSPGIDVSNLSRAWNAGGTTFTGIKLNVTDTASAAASLLMDLQVASVSMVNIRKDGIIFGVTGSNGTVQPVLYGGWQSRSGGSVGWTIYSGNNTANNAIFQVKKSDGNPVLGADGAHIYSNGGYGFGSIATNGDLFLERDAANTLAQRNGTAAQILRGYRSFTNTTNYTRWVLQTAANTIELAAESAGSGDANIDILFTPKGTGNVKFGTHSGIGIELVTGFITIKDSGGTARKIAVVS